MSHAHWSVELHKYCNGEKVCQQKVERLTPSMTIEDLIKKKKAALKFSEEENNLTARMSDGTVLDLSLPLEDQLYDGATIIIENKAKETTTTSSSPVDLRPSFSQTLEVTVPASMTDGQENEEKVGGESRTGSD